MFPFYAMRHPLASASTPLFLFLSTTLATHLESK